MTKLKKEDLRKQIAYIQEQLDEFRNSFYEEQSKRCIWMKLAIGSIAVNVVLLLMIAMFC